LSSPLPPSEVGSVLKYLRAAVRWIARLAKADHSTLYGMRWRVDAGRMPRPYVHVAVAPSRRLRKKLNGDFPTAARGFVASVFPDVFPKHPVLSTREIVRFQVPSDLGKPMDYLIELSPTGLVEILWILRMEASDDHLRLPMVDVGGTVWNLADAVQRGHYGRLFPRRSLARRKRIDWFVNVTGAWSEDGYKEWNDVSFPGSEPSMRATGHRAFSPVNGYGVEALRSMRQSTDPSKIVDPVLNDFLRENGFIDYAQTLEELMQAARLSH
jgi:hypothetical protein